MKPDWRGRFGTFDWFETGSVSFPDLVEVGEGELLAGDPGHHLLAAGEEPAECRLDGDGETWPPSAEFLNKELRSHLQGFVGGLEGGGVNAFLSPAGSRTCGS